MIDVVKRFSIVHEAKVHVFLEFPCFFYDAVYFGNLISGFSAFFKPNLYIWKLSAYIIEKNINHRKCIK